MEKFLLKLELFILILLFFKNKGFKIGTWNEVILSIISSNVTPNKANAFWFVNVSNLIYNVSKGKISFVAITLITLSELQFLNYI